MATLSQNDLENALVAHQAGRLAEAEAVYRQFGAEMPDNADVWHLLGALCQQKGVIPEAQQYLDRAIELNPDFPEALNTRSILLKELGQLPAAERDLRKALSLVPEFPQALTNLAEIRRLSGDFDEATKLNKQAITLAPELASAHNNLGATHRDLSDFDAAIAAFRHALSLEPILTDAEINLAATLNLAGSAEEALSVAQQAAANAPDYAPARNALGLIYFDSGMISEARRCFEKACLLDSEYGEAQGNLANSLTRLNLLDEAINRFGIALKVAPDNADIWANKAAALQAQNKIGEALEAAEQALKLSPDHADGHWNRGIARLVSGDLKSGFTDYEWRWQLPEFKSRDFDAPQLKNTGDITGKTILIHAEQGYGDTLQFVRYIQLIAEQNPQAIYLETHEPLKSLMTTVPNIAQVYLQGETLPSFDVHIPIMSLPHLFGTSLKTIPADTPYLTAPAESPIDLSKEPKTKIGLVWAGRPSHKNDRNRSLPVEALTPLFEVENIACYSLQLGENVNDISTIPAITDLSSHLTDFAATAAIIEQLDLIITVDTAVAHLAGALAKKCWVLLPFAPDWRWLLERNDSPWYASVKLFRQAAPGDWPNVIERVCQEFAD